MIKITDKEGKRKNGGINIEKENKTKKKEKVRIKNMGDHKEYKKCNEEVKIEVKKVS